MPKIIISLISLLSFVFSFSQDTSSVYQLSDFYRYHPMLGQEVDEIFQAMSEEERVGQMIVQAAGRLGKPKAQVVKLVQEHKIGGILLLRGEKQEFIELAKELDSLAIAAGNLPLLFSSDAEPSLFNRKISGTRAVKRTNKIEDEEECSAIAQQISEDLKEIGIYHNFSPVSDVSPNNEAIGNRSFGADPERVASMSAAFIKTSQENGVAATAKHFPGHGLVKGDSHHKMVFIDGEMQEVSIYQPLIDSGVISIMVGHIAIENSEYDTDGLPATCSAAIVTDLLKNDMDFRGVIVTDAMGMGAVTSIPNAPLKAVRAGCDMILMPRDEPGMITAVVAEMKEDINFRRQVHISVKKLIRLKLCLGVITSTME